MKYAILKYLIKYKDIVVWNKGPSFVYRSVIGYNLHKISCVLRNQKSCVDCFLNKTCAYASFFETTIDKDNSIIEGRDKVSHPYVINYLKQDDKSGILTITYIGNGCNYIPHVHEALLNGEEKGIGKNRVPYYIECITSDNHEVDLTVSNMNKIFKNWPSKTFDLPQNLILKLTTPCRIKKGGLYVSTVDFELLIESIYKRMQILESMYGYAEILENPINHQFPKATIIRERWIDKNYYSSRQQDLLKLGGVIGDIQVNDIFDETIKNYIEAMTIFNVGKNISFGLGRVEIEEVFL